MSALSALLPGCNAEERPATEGTSPAPIASGEWRTTADPPPSVPSLDAPTIWAGDRVIVFGRVGSSGPATGASYDPATNQWKTLPAAPIGPRSQHSAVWTGDEVIFWGRYPEGAGPRDGTPAGAAYNPKTQTWRVLPDAPIPDRVEHEAVWTGREMIIWGGLEGNWRPIESVLHARSAAAYDPGTDTWRKLADVPEPWSGEGPAALTFVDDGRLFILRGARFATLKGGGDGWQQAGEPAPAFARISTCPQSTSSGDLTGAQSGDEIFLWRAHCGRYRGYAFSLDSQRWRPVADALFYEPPSELATGGGWFYAAADYKGKVRVFRYQIDRDRWEDLPTPIVDIARSPRVMWTGTELLVMNGYAIDDRPRPGAAFDPRG